MIGKILIGENEGEMQWLSDTKGVDVTGYVMALIVGTEDCPDEIWLYRENLASCEPVKLKRTYAGTYTVDGRVSRFDVDANLDEFVDDYITAMLFSSTDENEEPLDDTYSSGDFDTESMEKIRSECREFLQDAGKYLSAARVLIDLGVKTYGNWAETNVVSKAGHDFWLTRVGHGAGFWDGDWPEHIDKALDRLAKDAGESYVYVGDDDKLYYQ